MRILHLISSLEPRHGGPIESVLTLAGFPEPGTTVEVATLDGPDATCLVNLGFPVHALGPVDGTYSYTRRLYPWLRENRQRFDGVVVHGLWQWTGLAAMLALRHGPPYLVFPHGMLDPYFKQRFPLKHIKKAFYWYLAEYWVLRRAARVLFTTESEQALARKSFAYSQWDGSVVPFGVRAPDADPESCKEAFLQRFPKLRGASYLLYLGRIHPKKGCDQLIAAFAGIASDAPGQCLVMAGPDASGWGRELESQAHHLGIADRVVWTGILRDEVKWGAFYLSEAFVLPSHQENFGMAVAEALATGTPALISDQVNIAEAIRNDGCAFIEPDTPEGTQRLLRRWLATPAAERAAMGERAEASFRARFNMRDTARAITGLLQRAIAERSR